LATRQFQRFSFNSHNLSELGKFQRRSWPETGLVPLQSKESVLFRLKHFGQNN